MERKLNSPSGPNTTSSSLVRLAKTRTEADIAKKSYENNHRYKEWKKPSCALAQERLYTEIKENLKIESYPALRNLLWNHSIRCHINGGCSATYYQIIISNNNNSGLEVYSYSLRTLFMTFTNNGYTDDIANGPNLIRLKFNTADWWRISGERENVARSDDSSQSYICLDSLKSYNRTEDTGDSRLKAW